MTPNFNLKISRQAALLVLVPLMAGFVFLLLQVATLQKSEDLIEQNRAKELIREANSISRLFYDGSVAMGRYRITRDPNYASRLEQIAQQVPLKVGELERSVGEDQKKQATFKHFKVIASNAVKHWQAGKADADENRIECSTFHSLQFYRNVRDDADQIQDALKELTADARNAKDSKQDSFSRSGMLMTFLLLVSFLLI